MIVNANHNDKTAFVTKTFLSFVRFGDYLAAVEQNIQYLNESGLNGFRQFVGTFDSAGAKRIVLAHRKRYERDMSTLCRYSSLTALYSLFEVSCRGFEADFRKTHSGKKPLEHFLKQRPPIGFVHAFRQWLESSPDSVNLPQNRVWNQLQDFQIIRNCIVHGHGDSKLSNNPKRTKAVISRTHKVILNPSGILVIQQEFTFEVMDRISAFFQRLFNVSGYQMQTPPGYSEMFTKQFAGHEAEIASRIKQYYLEKEINLGGQL